VAQQLLVLQQMAQVVAVQELLEMELLLLV
jgi:hypothetical protein